MLQINVLSCFPGVKQTKGNQPKLLKKIVGCIMDRDFLAKFSFTGKLAKGQRKISFQNQKNIMALLYPIASKIDKTFEEEDVSGYLKDKILRYAAE